MMNDLICLIYYHNSNKAKYTHNDIELFDKKGKHLTVQTSALILPMLPMLTPCATEVMSTITKQGSTISKADIMIRCWDGS